MSHASTDHEYCNGRPQDSSMPLSHFPCEVWQVISPFLHCSDIIRLWCSGDSRLRVLLGPQGGIRRLILSTDARSNIVVPQLIYQLPHLEYLSIRLIDHASVTLQGLNVQSLPRKLKGLAITMFQPHLPLIRHVKDTKEEDNMLIPLANLFPQLESLSLIGDLKNVDESFCQALPAHILSLRLLSHTVGLIDLESMPKSLTDLRLERIFATNRSDVTVLPPSLRRYFGEIYIGENTTLPSTLTHLDTMIGASVAGTKFPQLPPLIHKLSLSLGQNMRFTVQDGKQLPPTLADLDLQLMEEIPREALLHLPSTLTRLILPPGEHLTDESIKSLPRGLLHLDMNYQSEITADMVDDLPKNLESLWMSLVGLEDDSLKRLPRTLKRLSILSIEQSKTRHLPPCLESLKVFRATLRTRWNNSKFPSTLKSFNCAMTDEFETICLPRELLELDASAESFVDDSALDLPKALVSLNLRTCSAALTNAFFAKLPCVVLTSLGCHSAEGRQVTDECIRYLPCTLTALSLNLPLITGECSGFLPPNLRSLQLHQSSAWHNADLARLPRTLRVLHLPRCTGFTKECLALLPPNLLTFENGSSLEFKNIPPHRTPEANLW